MQKIIMKDKDIEKAISRMVEQFIVSNNGLKDVDAAVVGIKTGGAILGKRMGALIKLKTGYSVPIGALDITLYRDDWTRIHAHPKVKSTEILFDIEDKLILLVDDVLYTGRTVRAAMDALIDFGRPAKIELAILVDRGHRELPIVPTYLGLDLPTSKDERVNVYLKEIHGIDLVTIERKSDK